MKKQLLAITLLIPTIACALVKKKEPAKVTPTNTIAKASGTTSTIESGAQASSSAQKLVEQYPKELADLLAGAMKASGVNIKDGDPESEAGKAAQDFVKGLQ